MKTENSVMGYVHKNFVHLNQSILKENINLTMQLLIFESKAICLQRKKIKVCNRRSSRFSSFFFSPESKSNHHTTYIYHKNFFNFIKFFLRKLKYDDNTISRPCDQSLKKYLRNLALQANIQPMPNNIMKRKLL